MQKRYLTALFFLLFAVACTKTPDSELQSPALDTTSLEISDDSIPQVCVDKTLDADTGQLSTQAVLLKKRNWPVKKVLKVYFLNGETFYQDKVMKYAKVWSTYANITFAKTSNREQSDIRVAFKYKGDTGSWSYVGNDALLVSKLKQTVNFGWFTKKTDDAEFSRVITHEFGHALGLVHEQSSPVVAIKWDKPKVYKYYAGAPNYWEKADVDANIFKKYSKTATQYTAFDAKSIMEYPVDGKLTTDHKSIGYNYYLSAADKKFIATVYPKTTAHN
jgi:serralysin